MLDGKRIINIDESTMGQGAYVRQSWFFKGSKNTHQIKPFGHRLSLIAAIDTHGSTYFAISQSTVDTPVFTAFLVRLAAILDAEDPEWRQTSILVIDNASYHKSDDTKRALAALDIPAMLTGPYGYDGSPAEKLFAHLKVGDLNPDDAQSGKR